jgi:signal transduction histidine kinase
LTGYALFYLNNSKRRKNEFEEFDEVISRFYDGEYNLKLDIGGEDIRDKLNSRLESLGKRLQIKDDTLIKEKEETKALVTDISHQLKTPISSIKMCYSLLDDAKLEPEERQEFLYRLNNQIGHLETLAEALINISRMETGMIEIKKEKLSILDTITGAINQVYLKAEAKNISIVMEPVNDRELETLKLPHDSKWTAEAIANVIDNGIKYSEPGKRILLRMMKQINYLRIEIEDEGIGIAKEEYNQIFKRFYRGKSKAVVNSEGSGIGLYLTRKILEEQSGSITVSSVTA